MNYIKYFFASKNPIKYARKLGVTVGKNCKINCNPIGAFGSEPYLVTLGDHVEITVGCRFITHDGGAWVFRENIHPDMDVFGPIKIGNNVFVGMNSTILPNVSIGNNVVIGAGSVVTKDIPDNSVAAGVPARVINDLKTYEEKMIAKSLPTKKMSANDKYLYLKQYKSEWFSK